MSKLLDSMRGPSRQRKNQCYGCKIPTSWPCRIASSVILILLLAAFASGLFFGIIKNKRAPSYGTLKDVEDLGTLPRHKVFISVEELLQMMEAGPITVLDAREEPSFLTQQGDAATGATIPGSQRVSWREFTTTGDRGPLKSPMAMASVLGARGVADDVPVVVYGGWSAPSAWGEEGRIYWHLDYLNHTQAYILYGGIYSWLQQPRKGRAKPQHGGFSPRPVETRRVNAQEIYSLLKSIGEQESPESVVIIDARTAREFEGETPFGEDRGGHIPTAQSYDWKRLFETSPGEEGNLKRPKQLINEFGELGVQESTVVISYCTGGVRSGFLYAVLRWLGYSVRNYAESFWEWSEIDDLPVTLN